jgi:hypothetical protein
VEELLKETGRDKVTELLNKVGFTWDASTKIKPDKGIGANFPTFQSVFDATFPPQPGQDAGGFTGGGTVHFPL